MILTYKYRIKDRRARKALRQHGWAANQVWNWCVAQQRDTEARYRAGAPKRKWATHFDLTRRACKGVGKELGLNQQSVGSVCEQFARSRDKAKRSPRYAGWSMFRTQLRYKCQQARAAYLDIDEKFTTQTCSCCGVIPASSPKGMGALGIRAWDCSNCGAHHDRDVNAARNILTLALSAQRRDDESWLSTNRHKG